MATSVDKVSEVALTTAAVSAACLVAAWLGSWEGRRSALREFQNDAVVAGFATKTVETFGGHVDEEIRFRWKSIHYKTGVVEGFEAK